MKRTIFTILKVVFVVLIILSCINIYKWYKENKRVKDIVSNVSTYLTVDDEVYSIDDEIIKYNPDTIGWLKVDNTSINYPVVKGSDNKYYLNHDYYKDKNSAGWIFMDSNNKLDDQNIVIYGHHRRDGSMFGTIDNLFKNHDDSKILLVINGENRYYQIFSVYKISNDDYYITKNFEDFDKTLEIFKSRSVYDYKKDLSNVEQIITLSTCSNDNKGRLVIHAYKI